MRAQLAVATPGTIALPGAAERVPLPDGSVDAIVAGEAYHWFDRAQAHLTAPPERRRAVEAAIRDLAASHPDLAGRETFELPYRTLIYRARRR